MKSVNVSPHGPMVALDPEGSGRLQDVFSETPLGWDPIAKRYVLRPSDFPTVVATAAGKGVELRPAPDLGTYLRKVAASLRAAQAFVDTLPGELYAFQRDGVAFMHGNPHAFIFDEMGLGKTVQALSALGPGGTGLVVGPASLRRNWQKECERWRPDIEPVIIQPGNSFAYPRPGQLVITSYGGLPPAPDKCGKAPRGLTLIADEAHYVKSYGSTKRPVQRTRRFRLMARRALKSEGCVWLMTGTPVLSNPAELWGLLQAVGLGPQLYLSQRRFTELFGGRTDGLGVVTWDPARIHPSAMEPLRGYVLRRKRAEVLQDMPPKSWTTRAVNLVTDADLLELLDNTDAEYRAALDDAATAAGESLEYFGGIDQLSYARKQLALAKIPAVLEIAREYQQADEPVVVFSAHRGPVEALAKLPGWGAIHGGIGDKARHQAVEDFQAGKLAGIALTIGAGGLGLTLTRSAHVVFVDRAWTPAANAQAEDRVARIGQTRPVTITELVADHTLDERISAVLARKRDTIDNTIERLNDVPRNTQRISTARELDRIADLIDGAS